MVKKKEELDKSEQRNATWRKNHAVIREAFLKLMRSGKKPPTLAAISEATKLSVTTVHGHCKELDFGEMTSPFRTMTPDVLRAIAIRAADPYEGSHQDAKLFLQVIEGWSEKTAHEAPPVAIQINVGLTEEQE